jgi:hypothetical protein
MEGVRETKDKVRETSDAVRAMRGGKRKKI